MAAGLILGGLSLAAWPAFEFLFNRPQRKADEARERAASMQEKLATYNMFRDLARQRAYSESLKHIGTAYQASERARPPVRTSLERSAHINAILAGHSERMAMAQIPTKPTPTELAAMRLLGGRL
jgi:hypothetical protein